MIFSHIFIYGFIFPYGKQHFFLHAFRAQRLHQYTLLHWIFSDFAETAAATPPALINGEMHLPYCRFSRMVLPLQFRIFHSSMPYVANASPSLPDGS